MTTRRPPKPCPSCGCQALPQKLEGQLMTVHWLECRGCGMASPKRESPEAAQEVWDRRAPLPGVPTAESHQVQLTRARMASRRETLGQMFASAKEVERQAENDRQGRHYLFQMIRLAHHGASPDIAVRKLREYQARQRAKAKEQAS